MAEMALSFAIDQVLPLVREEVYRIKGVHKEFSEIKDELNIMQAFLKDAEKRAATDGDNNREVIKIWVKQVMETSFRIEDIVDEYMIYLAQKPRDLGCASLHHKIGQFIKSLITRHQIASKIQDIKSSLHVINKRIHHYGLHYEQGSNSFRGSRNANWYNLREDILFIEEAEVVGFEKQTHELIDWLEKGRKERTVVVVEGMGGQGKTTLTKKVFNNKDVIRHFDCRAMVTVSQSYDVVALLRNIYKQIGGSEDISQMDRNSLTIEVNKHLQEKRYLVVFDDVWIERFWDDIKFNRVDNKNGSRIIITTRNLNIAAYCEKSSFTEVLKLQLLTEKEALKLFYNKAFGFHHGGRCPEELNDVAREIVKKCKGLPLAIVAIGGLLSAKEIDVSKWKSLSENPSLELNKNTNLVEMNKILGLSYDDLPYNLKPCLLYFGIYPEDYEVNSKRIIQQWIAEGFVDYERGKTLEEVAEGYLIELIHRSLVQVSSIRIFDGKPIRCRVHDLIRDMIVEKFEYLKFCKHIISEDGHSSSSGIIRRLSIRTISDDLMAHIESSHVRSVLNFIDDKSDEETITGFVRRILTESRMLKVFDFECPSWLYPRLYYDVPEMLGSLVHLKYLSLKHGNLSKLPLLPKSIGMLQNLETLNLKYTGVRELPKEISKLRKLRHLIGNDLSLIQLKDGIGEMTCLQTLRKVDLGMDGVVEVIKELGKLKQIRNLELLNVQVEHVSILSYSINEMKHLKKLEVSSHSKAEIDLHLIPAPPMLQKLHLEGRLQKLPEWIPKLQNLLMLDLTYSNLTNDPLQSLKNMQLSVLYVREDAYKGLSFHFQDGWFQKLKKLIISELNELRYITIDKGALPILKKLMLCNLRMERTPTGIQYLEKLEVLRMFNMGAEFMKKLSLDEHWNQFRKNHASEVKF